MIYATVPLQFRFNCNQTNKLHYYNFDHNVPISRKGNLSRIQLGKTFIDHNLLNRLIPRGIAGLYFQDSRSISLTFFAPVKVSIILFCCCCFLLFFILKKEPHSSWSSFANERRPTQNYVKFSLFYTRWFHDSLTLTNP